MMTWAKKLRRGPATIAALLAAVALMTWQSIALSGSVHAQAVDDTDGDVAAARQRAVIRFLTTDDYPPFNSRDEDGVLTGLNVDLARAICLELATGYDLQVRPWDNLIEDLVAGRADAVIAAHKVTQEALEKIDFTDRYFFTPARFISRRDAPGLTATPTGLDGRTAGVIQGSPHEAFLQRYFRNTRAKAFPTAEAAREAMVSGAVDLLFDDGISLAFWANGTLSRNCCRLLNGAFFEPAYFGDGVAIAVGLKDRDLRSQINDALKRIKTSGRFQELVDRYFPIKVY